MRTGLLQLLAGGTLLAVGGGAAMAQDDGNATRAVFVERQDQSIDGLLVRSLVPAERMRRGDRVVTVVEWPRRAARRPTTVTARIPATLAFQRSSHDPLMRVSPDGGRRWGRLGTMRIGGRLVSPEEVTDLRWTIPARLTARRVTYSAIVR